MTAVRVEQIGGATLYLGDCLEVISGILDQVTCCLTDSPYGDDYRSGHATDALWKGGRRIANDASTEVRDAALAMLGEVPTLCFGSRERAAPAGTRMTLIWDTKGALGMGDLSLPWKPSSQRIHVLGTGFVGRRDSGDVIRCAPVQSMARNGREHPNEKPVALLKALLRKMPEGTVLDPFMGSGSTGVAALQMERPFIGIELIPEYFEIACRRIAEAARQPALFRDGAA